MFLPNVHMGQMVWRKWLFYMAAVDYTHIFCAAWDGKVAWLHICSLATIEAHSKTLESGFLNILMWCACGFAHNIGSIIVWENILLYCKSIPVYKVTSCLCSWMSSYKSAHICGSIQHSRCSIDTLRPEDTERQPAVQHIHLLNLIQFHSSLNLLSPQGNTF